MPTCGRCNNQFDQGDPFAVLDVGQRCYRCFNLDMAGQLGVAFEDVQFQPVALYTDSGGVVHTFQIRSMLVPSGHELEAVEMPGLAPGGYRFAVLGTVDADPRALFQSLHQKMRRELAVRHVEHTSHGWQVGPHNRFVGRIEWDTRTNGRARRSS